MTNTDCWRRVQFLEPPAQPETAGIHSGDATNGARLATDGQTGAVPTDRAGKEKRDAEEDA